MQRQKLSAASTYLVYAVPGMVMMVKWLLNDRLYAGPEIDIWSCGVILYVMLCGRLPFDDDHIPLLFKKINGGIYSLPPFLSSEARYLLSRMLVVDSNRRIRISEIRQLDWFKENLPPYLASPSLAQQEKLEKEQQIKEREKRQRAASHEPQLQKDKVEGDAGGAAESMDGALHTEVGQQAAMTDGTASSVGDELPNGEFIKDVGLVDHEGVEELCSKIPGLASEDVWESLRIGADKQLRIAYQLVRDSRSMGIDPRMMAMPPEQTSHLAKNDLDNGDSVGDHTFDILTEGLISVITNTCRRHAHHLFEEILMRQSTLRDLTHSWYQISGSSNHRYLFRRWMNRTQSTQVVHCSAIVYSPLFLGNL